MRVIFTYVCPRERQRVRRQPEQYCVMDKHSLSAGKKCVTAYIENMGTERSEVLNRPCFCGKGRITVTFCSPDHAYAHDGQTWREDRIECSDCDSKYTIVEQAKDLVLVSRADYEQTKTAQCQQEQELKGLEKRVWENLEKNGELDSVVNYLNNFKTAAAAYRCLSDMYVFRDIDAFRKKFSKQECTKEWVKKHFYPRALEKLLALIPVPSETLACYFKDDSDVRNRAVPIPRPIGEPILHLNR
jgi:hypothetical protein